MTRVTLGRHGQSEANARGYDNRNVADSLIPLTDLGWKQGRERGKELGHLFFDSALIYCSPYIRTRQTLQAMFEGAGFDPVKRAKRIYEDPRLREVEHGYEPFEPQKELQNIHGSFFYRLNGGESPADCYDRVSTFLESLKRRIKSTGLNDVFIMSHGLTIRCFVMRFLHLTVEQYNQMKNPQNAALIRIAPIHYLANPIFTSSKWGVEGIELR